MEDHSTSQSDQIIAPIPKKSKQCCLSFFFYLVVFILVIFAAVVFAQVFFFLAPTYNFRITVSNQSFWIIVI